jgi:hopanoid biosynthesis associated radical SAM protein HpnH
VGVPLIQQIRVGAYIIKQRVRRNRHYPLVLMLEPLFRCNLACPGCGKIDYPDAILNKRLSVEDCIQAAEECGAPIVSIPGGEPLLHKEIDQVVAGLVARKKFVYLCTNALLMEKKLDLFKPSPYFTFSVHLDGGRAHHDKAVDQEGTFDKAVAAIAKAKAKGFRVNINSTLFDGVDAAEMAAFFTYVSDELDIDGITVSPGYAYERAPNQEHFLNRRKTKELFRDIFRRGKGRKWRFSQSALFLDFLAGNQTYKCTPWSNPTRNVFGWQRPCYLLGEGYANSFKSLIEDTDWDAYGTGNYAKCADCMVHCGYEGTAVDDSVSKPWKALKVALFGPGTEGEFAAEIDLEKARPAEYVFEKQVYDVLKNTELSARDKRWMERNPAPPADEQTRASA